MCRKSAREQGWDMVLGRGPGQTEAQGKGRAMMSPELRDQQELESQHRTHPDLVLSLLPVLLVSCMTLPLPPLSSMHTLRYKNYFGK